MSSEGFVLGHGLVEFLTGLYEKSEAIGISGMVLVKGEFYVLLISVGVGVLASILPAFNAYRTDISKVLAQE